MVTKGDNFYRANLTFVFISKKLFIYLWVEKNMFNTFMCVSFIKVMPFLKRKESKVQTHLTVEWSKKHFKRIWRNRRIKSFCCRNLRNFHQCCLLMCYILAHQFWIRQLSLCLMK